MSQDPTQTKPTYVSNVFGLHNPKMATVFSSSLQGTRERPRVGKVIVLLKRKYSIYGEN